MKLHSINKTLCFLLTSLILFTSCDMNGFSRIQKDHLSSIGYPSGDESFDMDELTDALYLNAGELLNNFNSISYEGSLSSWEHDDIIHPDEEYLVHRNILYWPFKGECMVLYVDKGDVFISASSNEKDALRCLKIALKTCK